MTSRIGAALLLAAAWAGSARAFSPPSQPRGNPPTGVGGTQIENPPQAPVPPLPEDPFLPPPGGGGPPAPGTPPVVCECPGPRTTPEPTSIVMGAMGAAF